MPVSPWQLRIELLDVQPQVWRRLLVPPRAPFASVCLAGENACPPEDISGPPGYTQFLVKGGKASDPARFDREAVNLVLVRLRA